MTMQSDDGRPRGELRREQILDAAAACFAREGFHGTSIARISKVAGMSPGHIYHFFENKESIIAALVARRLEHSLAMVRQFENAEDVFQALLDRVDIGLRERTDPIQAALELEILAEAARNPRVAGIVRQADTAKRERFQALLRNLRGGRATSREDAAAIEVIMALFEGLMSRVVNHPELDREALLPGLRTALRALI